VLGLEGQRLVMMRRDAEALPLLARAAADAPDDPDVAYGLGLAHARLAHVREARAAFERAVQIEPRFYDAWLRLATAAHLLGDGAARDAALARAASLPDARDGRVDAMARRLAALAPPERLNP
jgi:tetratricopeptide (TPR) repeat protein